MEDKKDGGVSLKGILREGNPKFRQEAVKLIVEDKIPCSEVAQGLSLAPPTLARIENFY